MFVELLALALCGSTKPMTWEQCAVTIDNLRWNVAITEVSHTLYEHKSDIDGWHFYVRMCEPLKESDLPDYYNITLVGANAVRCNDTAKICYPFASIYDFEWTPKNPSDLSQGVIWESDGIPNMVGIDKWEDWEMEFEFDCDHMTESFDPQYIYDFTKEDKRLVIKFENVFSCGQITKETPTPTPAFEPDTDVFFREPGSQGYGIMMDMKDVDGGRFGLTSVVWYDAKADPPDVRFLIVNPTRRMYDCPWGAKCDPIGENGTSAWLCTFKKDSHDLDYCENYGYALEDWTPDLLVDADITKGWYFRMGDTGGENPRHVQFNVLCDNVYPEGHLLIDPMQTKFMGKDNSYLIVVGESKDACIKPVPTTAPLPGCNIKETLEGYTLDLDLMDYNKEWKREVTVKTSSGEQTDPMDLIYKPCHGMVCPDGYDCDGAEDALVWLCEKKKAALGHVPFCTGYGLHDENLRLSITGNYIFAGVDATMRGENKRMSIAHWQCNNSVASGQVYIESPVTLSGKTLRFDVHAPTACATGSGPTPTPVPPPAPPKPLKGPTPTPTPEISPNPIDFLYNETHYIYVNLEHAQEPVMSRNVRLMVNGQSTIAYVEWSSWEQIPCPATWAVWHACGEFEMANLWVCWFPDMQPYCHPVADKYVPGQHTRVKREDNLDAGIHIIYEGQYGVNMEIIATCDPSAIWNRTIPLWNSTAVYQSTVANGEWTFNSSTGVACPRRFETPEAPKTPRDPPSGDEKQTTDFEQNFGEDSISFNLRKMKPVHEEVFLGVNGQMHKAEIHFSPYDLIGCPKEGACKNYEDDVANVWKCIGLNYNKCYPIGDRRYGLEIDVVNSSNILAGLTANYNGGAEKTEVHFQFQCNYSVPYGEITFDETGVETRNRTPVIYAHTRHACPNHNNDTRVGGGGIFLMIVFSAIVAYVALGSLAMFVITGRVALPFAEFWSEVGKSIVYVFTLLTGRAGGSNETVSYDKI